MTDEFRDPATPTGLDYNTLKGALLLFTVHAVETDINTSYGLTDAVRADIAVLDGEHKGDEYEDALIFPKVLQSQLRSSVGSMVLGRLGQGNAKPGQSAPWTLNAANDAERETGRKYLAYAAQRKIEQEAPF